MVDKKISELTNITGANLADADEFVVVDTSANETKAITYAELKSGLDTSTGFVRVTGDTMTGNLSFGDNNKAIFGAGSDLQIYHDGGNSVITNSTGNLIIRDSVGGNILIQGLQNQPSVDAIANGAVNLYYSGNPKLATTPTGVDVTGTVTADGLTVDGNITSTGGDLNLATLDLNAIAASKAVTAVDVFVYDTSKDSDGGAWRKRTQHTSWYNETLNTATRGSRREFPAVAVIVAEATKVTIYDGDDPSLPMWMVIPDGGHITGNTSVTAFNSVILIGTSLYGVVLIDFTEDAISRHRSIVLASGFKLPSRLISDRSVSATAFDGSLPAIINSTVNDVAMTVLPDAPIDPATGLPVPTIAVATAGGVSVITDSGAVYDSAYTGAAGSISFTDDNGLLFALHSAASNSSLYLAEPDVFVSDGWASTTIGGNSGLNGFPVLGTTANDSLFSSGLSQIAQAGGLSKILWNSTENQSLLNYTTSTYNTGWMNGDIKGAFLSSTDTASLVGSGAIANGAFDTDLSGWTYDAAAWSWDASGRAYHNFDEALGAKALITDFPGGEPSVGDQFYFSFDYEVLAGSLTVGDDYSSISGGMRFISGSGTASGLITITDGRQNRFAIWPDNVNQLVQAYVDNVVVRKANSRDRSVNNKGLIVNGTVTRSPVATGAELVAYSGFSSSNYLEQPYNSALDFGTGDFCVMGWSKGARAIHPMFSKNNGSAYSIIFGGYSSTTFWFGTKDGSGTSTIIATSSHYSNVWNHHCGVRKDGVMYLYENGVLIGTSSNTARNVAQANDVLAVGYDASGSGGISGSNLYALLRISATAPTAEQIKKIYEDEKVLFQDNAACTLYGTSDAVTALAHDEDTGLLHVGTSAGRSVFQGLRRVSNTTTAVGTAISASNGMIAEE